MGTTTELFMGMRSLFRLYDKMLKKVCTEHDLTIVEADIISFLQNKGAVSKAVESLIQKSLLERIPDTEDRRKIHLKLKTQVGPVAESIDEVRTEFINTVLEGFTKEELKVYAGFRDRLFDNIKKAMEGSDKI